MSAPNVDGPNQSALGSAANSAANAVNYVKDSVLGSSAEAKKETGKEQAKGNVPGSTSISDRVAGAADAVSGKADQSKYDASSKANKESI